MGPCPDTEFRLSYRGFQHCALHLEYQVAFAQWKCQCYTGQCRPTEFRRSRSANSVTGYEIMVDGQWFDIPAEAFRKERANMTGPLLAWDAHVCAGQIPVATAENKSPKPHIECAWVKLEA